MKRREFIAMLAGLVAASSVVEAQQTQVRRIGILAPESPPVGLVDALRRGLRELGYVDGDSIAFEVRSAEGYGQRLAALANQLVDLKVDVIIAVNTPSVQAAKKATATIPIVMMRVADPVASGLVPSLSRPGGNVTGLSFMVDELSGKRLALLKEALPSIARVAVLWFEPNPGSDVVVRATNAAARALGLELIHLPVRGPDDLAGAFKAATRGQVDAVFVIEDTVATKHRVEILNLAATHSLAVVSQYQTFAEAGALIAYGPSLSAMYHRAAYYIDHILKGARVDELPVEQPTKFDLVINLKTAKALSLTLPATLLVRADELID